MGPCFRVQCCPVSGAGLQAACPLTCSNSDGSGSSGSCRRRSSSGGWRTCRPCGGRRSGGRPSASRYSAPSAHRTHPFPPWPPLLLLLPACPAPQAPSPSLPPPEFLLSFPASLSLSVFSHPSTPYPGSLPSSCLCAFIPHLFAPRPDSCLLHRPSWGLCPGVPLIPCLCGAHPTPDSLLLSPTPHPGLLLILTPLTPSSNSFAAAAAPHPPASPSLPALCPPPRPPGVYPSQARGGAATARDPSATAAPGTGPAAGNGVPSFPREDAHSEHLRRSGTGALQGKGSPGHQGKRPLLSRQLEESKGVPALASRAHPAEPSLPTLGPRNTSGSSWRSNGSPSACRGSCSRSTPTSSPCSSSSNSSSFRNSSRSCPGTGSPCITTVGASTLPTSQPGPERYSAPPVLPETPSVIAHGRPRGGERAGSASGWCWRGWDVTWRTGQKPSCLASCRITGGRENKDEQTAELSLGQEQARQHRA